jgi:6-phosphogluconolactonase
MASSREIRVAADSWTALRTAAVVLQETAGKAVAQAGCMSLAVSGGTTPRGMHRLLAQPPLVAGLPWDRMHLFWADERIVPYDDPASNFGCARVDFIEHLPRPLAAVHPIPVSGDIEALARRYEDELRDHFRRRHLTEPAFDLIFLGLGADGHTASLLPGSAALGEQLRWVAPVKGGEREMGRITLTPVVLNRARRIVFLVTGSNKAAVVHHVLTASSPLLPAQRICPQGGQVTWILDRAAAALLENLTSPTADEGKEACRTS